MANPIKWLKSLLEFPTTEKDDSATLDNTCYNSQITPTTFNASIAAPFSFKAPGESTFETTDSFTLSNQKYTVDNSTFTFGPEEVKAHTTRYKQHTRLDLSPSITYDYVFTVGEQFTEPASTHVWCSLHDATDNSVIATDEVSALFINDYLGTSNAVVSDTRQNINSKFFFYVNKDIEGTIKAYIYWMNKSTGVLTATPIEIYDIEAYPESWINCIRMSSDGNKLYFAGYSLAGGNTRALVGKIDAVTLTIDYVTTFAPGLDEYKITTFDIDEANSPDAYNYNFNLIFGVKISTAGTDQYNYAYAGVKDTGSSFTIGTLYEVECDHINTYPKTMKNINGKCYSSDYNEAFNETSDMFRHNVRFSVIKSGLAAAAVYSHVSLGVTTGIKTYYGRIDIIPQQLTTVTGVRLIDHGGELSLAINGTGQLYMFNSTNNIFTSTQTITSLKLNKIEVERYYDSDTDDYEWILKLNDEEITIAEAAEYDSDITIDSGEEVELGLNFVTASPAVFCYSQVNLNPVGRSTSSNVVFQSDHNSDADATQANIGSYVSGTVAVVHGIGEEEEKINLAGHYLDNTYFKLSPFLLGQFVFFGTDISHMYCSTLRIDTALDIQSGKIGYYDNFETSSHIIKTGDNFYSTGLSLFGDERLFFVYNNQTTASESITCFSNNIDADFTDNTDTMTVKFAPTAANYYSDDIDVTENEDFTCTGLSVEAETLTNPYGLIKMNVGNKDFYKTASDNSDKQSVYFYVKDTKLKDYYDRGGDTDKYYYDNSNAVFQVDASATYNKVEMQTEYQASDTNYDSYLDTINIYYDPSLKEELLADNAVNIVCNFAISMLKAELQWTVDSNYKFNTEKNYWQLGDLTETGRIESTYAGSYSVYAQGTKQIQIKSTTVDDRSANSIRLRISARLTDTDSANTYYDEWKLFSINLLPSELFYLEGDENA